MNDTARNSREGSQFGRYHLKRLLGHGATGEVYEAVDTSNQRVVALKVWPPAFSYDRVFCARLQRQARVIGQLDEPHIVPIHDCGEIGGQQFLDMRLVEGTDLSKLLRRPEPLSPPRAVAIVTQIASALDAAHAVGIVHGDVKPANILITPDDFVSLVDFGIADAAPHKGMARVIGSAVETWKYSAPERFTGSVINHHVDIYALSCVLYECLTGLPPYWADSAGALVSAHLNDPYPRPSTVQPTVPSAFDDVIACGMAKDPAERYPSAGDLALAAYEALSAAKQDGKPQISTSCKQAPEHDAQTGVSSVPTASSPPTAPTSDVSAHLAHRGPSVGESLPSPAEPSAPTPEGLPRFGLDGPGLPTEGKIPPGSRPPRAKPRNQRRWRRGAAVVLIVAALSSVIIWLLYPSQSTSSGSETTSAASTPTSSAAETPRLFGLLPRGYLPETCKTVAPQHNALATVSCDRNSDLNGPSSATYMLFADTTSLRGAFDQLVQASTVITCPGRIQSPGPWHRIATPDKASGMLLCATQGDGSALGWTDDAALLLGVVSAEPPEPSIDQLYMWWMSHS
jgi:serine/threonine protein kinase